MPNFVCEESNHNKFWKYELIDDTTVKVSWGRLGLKGEEKTHTFPNRTKRDLFVSKKTTEKERKGYKPAESEQIEKKAEIAQKLGIQHKISRVEYVNWDEDLIILPDYDPSQHLYVEVQNSWTGDIKRFLFSRKDSFNIAGQPSESKSRITNIVTYPLRNDKMAEGIRLFLKELAVKVTKAVKLNALGVRKLLVDGRTNGAVAAVAEEVSEIIQDSNASNQVVMKFAALGARKLVL